MTNPYQQPQPGSLAPLNVRRTSYASVVSGSQQAAPRPATRSSAVAFSNILNPSLDSDNAFHSSQNHFIDPTITMPGMTHASRNGVSNADDRNNVAYGINSSWGSNGMSSAFVHFCDKYKLEYPRTEIDTNIYDATGAGANTSTYDIQATGFLAPSYLRGSVYLQRLEEKHRARIIAERERELSGSKTQPRSGLASNGNGHHTPSAHGPKLHHPSGATHRGVAFDVVEKGAVSPTEENDGINPLPSKWNKYDKEGILEVSNDGYEVTVGTNSTRALSDQEAASVRADHWVDPSCGLYYFEVLVLNRKRGGSEDVPIGVGFAAKSASLLRAPGWEPESWGYHGDDGHCFAAQNTGKPYGPKFGPGDTIGCLLNFRKGHILYTKNGRELKVAFRDINFKDIKGKIYPIVGLKKQGDHIWANFGQVPFMFDIDGYMKKQREIVANEIRVADTRKHLAPDLTETELIQQLVLQFLQHDGYVETARAFAEEIHAEKTALRLNNKEPVKGINIKDDEDANNRQRIRRAILNGDIDKAMELTNANYPNVLKENEQVYFRLRCRKFIEMIRKEAELNMVLANKYNNGGTGRKAGGEFEDEEMLDDEEDGWEDDDEQYEAEVEQLNRLSQEAIAYGQELRTQFASESDGSKPEISKHLDEIFSLIAYSNPLTVPAVAHLLDGTGRVAVAEELNSAILTSLGKSSRAALGNVYAQTCVLLEELRKDGGDGAFVKVEDVIRQIPPSTLL
ncbi:hypothetical protein QBC38DRAFT_507603 [Podospora fimiseda]|uniref:Protein SSH4 n=1 Tax=Podospora fimiseda TaxID=252190 RepID=A0AAN7H3W8_9PEZI|nr:hypothetical protein QBC38DRAFT_507603 [Podospora fimiseda]